MQKRTMLSKNDTEKSMKKNKIAKREWEGDDYSPITSEKDIEHALREEYSRFDSLVKLEYVGTDWVMGSQYWVALFKKKGGNSESFPYACVTVIDWTYDFPQRGIITDGYVDGELDEMESVYQHKIDSLKRGTRKSMMKSKGEKMKSKGSMVKNKKVHYHRWSSTAYDIWDALKVIDDELYDKYWDNAPDNHWTEMESNLYHQIDDGLKELESAVNSYYDLLSDADYSASAKKSKVSKPQISKRFAKSYIKRIMAYSKLSKMEKSKLKKEYNGWENHSTWAFMLHWNNDPYLANLPYELIENEEVESYQELQNRIYDEIDMLIDSIKEEIYGLSPIAQDICAFAVEQVNTHQCMNAIMDEAEYHNAKASYSASAKKSKRDILKAKVDELLEEDEDEIAKPRMKDMFLDSKRKSRKSTKSNNEKGEDADEYREESDGDDVSDSKVMKPEEANDNEDENEAPSGGNSSLPEDADGQENQSAKRKKRMSKFSVTTGGSQRYDGRQNYNQSPMMRDAIDRFKAEKDLVKSLQDRVDEINGARKNTEVNNKSPLRIKGRY